jgi:hypothetical protein
MLVSYRLSKDAIGDWELIEKEPVVVKNQVDAFYCFSNITSYANV